MSLLDLDIEQLVNQETSRYLRTNPTYHTLREHNLAIKPISNVVDAVNQQLLVVSDADKAQVKKELIVTACQRQVREDQAEESADAQQRSSDNGLIASEYRQIQDNQRQMEVHTGAINNINYEIDYLRHRLNWINLTMNRYNPGIAYGYCNGYDHHHRHGHYTHYHAYPNEMFNGYNWRLSNELSRLESRRNSLESLKARLEINNVSLSDKIYRIFPARERMRQERANARGLRAQARLTQDLTLAQLSPAVSFDLQKNVTSQHASIDVTRQKLKQKVDEQSYATYLTLLEARLPAAGGLKLKEKESLKQMVGLMQGYLNAKEMERQEQLLLNKEIKTLNEINRALNESRRCLNYNQKNTPELKKKNSRITEENKQREQIIQKRQPLIKYLIIGGVVSLALTGLLSAVPLFWVAAPVLALFIPAIIVGVAALGCFVAAAVLGFLNVSNKRRIEDNQDMLKLNANIIEGQDSSSESLENVEIPKFVNQQSAQEGVVQEVALRVDQYKKAAEDYQRKAANLNLASPGGFFAPAPPRKPLDDMPASPLRPVFS